MSATAYPLMAASYLAAATVYFGVKTPGYNHVRFTISELGAAGTAFQRRVSWGVFLPVSLICLGIAVQLYLLEAHWPRVVLSASLGVGYGVAAAFPCDIGSPLQGTLRNQIHLIGGGIQYVGGAASLAYLSAHAAYWQDVYGSAAWLVLVMLVAMFLPRLNRYRGLIQRFGEVALFVSLVLAVSTAAESSRA